ncbi:hypothetical protein HY612_01965 [Candidatus Roizmanbacteria bacterium]|nr:hypothetical protein [Candidatus Roizmanbacteria bacterium]
MTFTGFIPQKLEIKGKPWLSIFPKNVLITTADKNQIYQIEIHYVKYLPDFSSYRENGQSQSMNYISEVDANFYLKITYNKKDFSYRGEKYYKEKPIALAFAKGWNLFFMKVSFIGIEKNEKYEK